MINKNKVFDFFKSDVVSGFQLQLVNTLGLVISAPFLLNHLGAETYGLVAMYSMVLNLLGLADFGITPTVSRNTNLFCIKKITAKKYRTVLLYSAVFLLLVSSLIVVLGLLFGATVISDNLKLDTLFADEVRIAVEYMIFGCLARWISQGYFRAILIGSGRLALANWICIFTSLMRNAIPIIILSIFTVPFYRYFQIVFIIALIEFLLLGLYASNIFSIVISDFRHAKDGLITSIRDELKFGVKIFAASLIGICLFQVDKILIVSNVELKIFGYFGFVMIIVGGVQMLASPIMQAATPKLLRLYSLGKWNEFENSLYRFSKILTLLSFFIFSVIYNSGESILLLWTGNLELADSMSVALSIYTLAFCFTNVGGILYVALYAKDRLNFHITGTAIFFVSILLSCIVLIPKYLIIGGAISWLMVSGIFVFIWLPIVLKKIGSNLQIVRVLFLSLLCSGLIKLLVFLCEYNFTLLDNPVYKISVSLLLSILVFWIFNKNFIFDFLKFEIFSKKASA